MAHVESTSLPTCVSRGSHVEAIWQRLVGFFFPLLKCFKRNKREGNKKTKMTLCLVTHVWTAWATRGSHVGHKVGHFGRTCPLAHPTRSSTVFGPPNSYFESVFRLRIVTPIRTTTTKKLCKNVEKSSQKTTSKMTQRMRMQSSIATSFGLET